MSELRETVDHFNRFWPKKKLLFANNNQKNNYTKFLIQGKTNG